MTFSLRSVLVIIGNIIYHFDRSLFNLLIPFLAPLFFPRIDPVYALICMFAIAPLEVLVKPLGGPLPAVSLWLYHQTGLIIAPALPLVFIGIFPLIYLARAKQSDLGKSTI